MLRRRVLLPDHVELAGMLPVARYVGRMERIEGRGEQGEVTQPRVALRAVRGSICP